MSFKIFMSVIQPDFDLEKGQITVNAAWLNRFWNAAQNCMLSSVLEEMRAINPCPVVVLGKPEAMKLMGMDNSEATLTG